ncbi:hypothetical protein ACFL6C_02075 [Myxococcota bacterium]
MQGRGISSNAVHPRAAATNLMRELPLPVRWLLRLLLPSPTKGAQTPLYVACAPEIEGVSGRYFERNAPVRSAPATYDAPLATRLWEVSAELVSLTERANGCPATY